MLDNNLRWSISLLHHFLTSDERFPSGAAYDFAHVGNMVFESESLGVTAHVVPSIDIDFDKCCMALSQWNELASLENSPLLEPVFPELLAFGDYSMVIWPLYQDISEDSDNPKHLTDLLTRLSVLPCPDDPEEGTAAYDMTTYYDGLVNQGMNLLSRIGYNDELLKMLISTVDLNSLDLDSNMGWMLGNVLQPRVVSVEGTPKLIEYEYLTRCCRDFIWTPAEILKNRFGLPEYAELAPEDKPEDFEGKVALTELLFTVNVGTQVRKGQFFHDEFKKRSRTLVGDLQADWVRLEN